MLSIYMQQTQLGVSQMKAHVVWSHHIKRKGNLCKQWWFVSLYSKIQYDLSNVSIFADEMNFINMLYTPEHWDVFIMYERIENVTLS